MITRFSLLALGATAISSLIMPLAAQSRAIGWGLFGFDSDVAQHPPAAVHAGDGVTTVLTANGRVYSRGATSLAVPELPVGRRYTQVATNHIVVAIVDDGSLRQWGQYPSFISSTHALPTIPSGVSALKATASHNYASALLSNGQIVAWGYDDIIAQNLNVPPLPSGTTYVDVTAGDGHSYALRSDGAWVSWGANNWGQRSGPNPPAGLGVVKIVAGFLTTAAILTDGTIQVWGHQANGQGNVPLPPPGRTFVDVSVGATHCLAKLSDGSLVAWGGNSSGQCNVPALPAGLSYTSFSAGRSHSVALRSDGAVMPFGYGAWEGPSMAVGPGQKLRSIKTGGLHCLAITAGGELLAGGADWAGQLAAPTLPPGVHWVDCAAGAYFSVGLGSDGILRAFGNNAEGQCNVPPLPPGLNYTQVAAGYSFAIALRSDGSAVTWGAAMTGPVPIPALPAGSSYRAVGAADDHAYLIRSDGSIAVAISYPRPPAPLLPPGVEYLDVTGSNLFGLALRSDGQVVMWTQFSSTRWHPTLPRGMHYVGIAALRDTGYARRSDGAIVECKLGLPLLPPQVPALPAGTSYHAVDAGWDYIAVATIGSRSSFVAFADGCDPGTEPAQLIPRDTPKLGQTMTLRINRMTQGVGALAFGWSRVQPGIDLKRFGMPGCLLHIVPDVVVPIAGASGWGQTNVPLPNVPALLGATWFQQAMLLDLAANPAGMKMSMAYEAVVGG